MNTLQAFASQLQANIAIIPPVAKIGHVARVTGLVIESDGPVASLGDVCEIRSPRRGLLVPAEVVGFRDHRLLLMPLGEMDQVHPGCEVIVSEQSSVVRTGPDLIGRVLDGMGNPIDDKGPIAGTTTRRLNAAPPNPLRRRRIEKLFHTGIKAIDLFTPLGCGQRMGIFAGSGVGKSTLLGMIAREAESDVNVIALIGERGRELREFIERDLGAEGISRSVIVVSTSDQPPPVRKRAAFLATALAEHFRDEGKKVLFLMDSVTRFAMAQREVGLAIGEPPTSRGFTPSVFSLLPRLLERTGMGELGSITALYTVLVEGDDLNEPITDTVRGILDGHIVLSRALATANHFPAIDVLESVSRLAREIVTEAEAQAAAGARDLLSTYRKHEDLINIGAYVKNSNPHVDRAIEFHPALMQLLRQRFEERQGRGESFEALAKLLS